MPIRLVAAAKGLAVGVLTLCISVAGALAYINWMSRGCPAEHPDCNAGLEALGILLEGAVVLFALLLVLGPLLAWAFRLPVPAFYLIPPFLIGFVDVLVLPQHVGALAQHSNFLLYVAPFAAYPVIAALSAGRRHQAAAPVRSPGSPASSR